jgi:putative endonuclease
VAYYVYMLASRRGGMLYAGVTNDLVRRIFEHREGLADGYTKRNQIKRLVWFEVHDSIRTAIQREKNIKHWPRAWKVARIEETNPAWRDLYEDIAAP